MIAFIGWATVAAAFSAVALLKLAFAARAPAVREAESLGQVVIVRPVDAPAAHELKALSESARLVTTAPFIIASPERPPGLPESLTWVASEPSCSNRKVGHLISVLDVLGDLPRETVVLCIDADVIVDEALVRALTAAIRSGACAASAAPAPPLGSTLASRATYGLLVQSHHSFVALDTMQLGAKAICGKAVALSVEALGEFRKLGEVVGEDLELSKVLHGQGRRVALVPSRARVSQSGSLTLREVAARFTRWMQVLRAHRPSLFPSVPLLFAPTPVLVVAALLLRSPMLACAAAGLVMVRLALANRLDERRVGLRFEWFFAEILLMLCWVRSLLRRGQVTWRGRRYQLRPGGMLTRLTERPSS